MSEEYLREVREESDRRFQELRKSLMPAHKMLGGKGCVYASGSYGRLEAGPKSDLDLFVVVKTYKREDKPDAPLKFRLKETEQIILKRELIVQAQDAGMPEFDGGGKFLKTHSFSSYTRYLGSQEDDYRNTLTGRMLLLLESKCLISDKVYNELLDDVIKAYFRDYASNEGQFLPSFLFNDIIRMWRTFCVNYEFYRRDKMRDGVKNLKLKYSRMLTCYSALLTLLSDYTQNHSVSPSNVKLMASKTPTERLEELVSRYAGSTSSDKRIRSNLDEALVDYSGFLQLVHGRDGEPAEVLKEEEEVWRKRSYEFGEKLTRAMSDIAGTDPLSNDLYRIVLI